MNNVLSEISEEGEPDIRPRPNLGPNNNIVPNVAANNTRPRLPIPGQRGVRIYAARGRRIMTCGENSILNNFYVLHFLIKGCLIQQQK